MHASRSLNGRPDKTGERPGMLDPGPVILQWKPRNECLGSRATYWNIGDEYQITGSVRSDRVQQLSRPCGREDTHHSQLRSTPAFVIGGNAANPGMVDRTGDSAVPAGKTSTANPFVEDCPSTPTVSMSRTLWRAGHYMEAAVVWVISRFRKGR